MSIFNKIFGGSDKSDKNSENKNLDLEQLLSSDDINNSIIEIDNFVCELCVWGDDLDKLSEPQKVFYFNQNLEREINNGGFNQFYFNSSGDFAHETIDSLMAIGAYKTAEIVKKANEQFPDNKVPKDRTQRQEILDQIEDQAKEFWDELDQMFFAYKDDLNSLNFNYIKQHKDKF